MVEKVGEKEKKGMENVWFKKMTSQRGKVIKAPGTGDIFITPIISWFGPTQDYYVGPTQP